MKKITILAGLTGLLIVLVAVGSYFLESPEERFESTREMMDTYVTIIVYHQDEGKAKKAIEAAFDRMKEIEGIASRFNTSSELYRLNEEGMVENPSPELKEMIEISVHYWNITGHAFDITILPLLNLWSGDHELFTANISHQEDLDAGIFP
ncbi:MAG: FAD:protein FMN transferase, partial [Thermoplasmata archaeon]|nr:FAD:protein FMN transferase [Thermoplasmata archaeon]